MPRKKSKKQLRLEEEANFVPSIVVIGERTYRHHAPGLFVRVDIESNDYTPYYNFLTLIDRLGLAKNK